MVTGVCVARGHIGTSKLGHTAELRPEHMPCRHASTQGELSTHYISINYCQLCGSVVYSEIFAYPTSSLISVSSGVLKLGQFSTNVKARFQLNAEVFLLKQLTCWVVKSALAVI